MSLKKIIETINEKKRYQDNDEEEEFYEEIPNVEFELIKRQNEDERRHFTTSECVYKITENGEFEGYVSCRLITNIYSECSGYEDCTNTVELKEVEPVEKIITEYVEV